VALRLSSRTSDDDAITLDLFIIESCIREPSVECAFLRCIDCMVAPFANDELTFLLDETFLGCHKGAGGPRSDRCVEDRLTG
jgi:hypothetical protein